MSTRQIVEAFNRWRAERVPVVMVTVVETAGSTYTKAGHRILIAGTGEFHGLVSGGCLEGDLAEHARAVLDSNQAQLITYDLRDENDELWGLGIGCNGVFRVLLQPLTAQTQYEPFSALGPRLLGDVPGLTATVVASNDPAVPAGAMFMTGADAPYTWQMPAAWRERLAATTRSESRTGQAHIRTEQLGGRTLKVLYAPLALVPRLLILGAGLDAVPLLDLANRLGWRITVADHRPAYLSRGDLQAAESVMHIDPAALARELPLAQFAAAVVMSHHLATDRTYLQALAGSAIPYIGLLGPVARRDRLLADLGSVGELLRARMRAPAGLSLGAHTPESIALAILAEIQITLTDSLQPLAENS